MVFSLATQLISSPNFVEQKYFFSPIYLFVEFCVGSTYFWFAGQLLRPNSSNAFLVFFRVGFWGFLGMGFGREFLWSQPNPSFGWDRNERLVKISFASSVQHNFRSLSTLSRTIKFGFRKIFGSRFVFFWLYVQVSRGFLFECFFFDLLYRFV
mgnify:CR=1 FL=1